MTTILVNGQDKTGQIKDWRISSSSQGLILRCYFPSGKTYTRPLEDCEIIPTEVMENKLLVKSGGDVFNPVDKVVVYGNKYAVIQYPGNSKLYVMKRSDFGLVDKADVTDTDLFQYFVSIAKSRVEDSKSQDSAKIASNVLRQIESMSLSSDTALNAYCTGCNNKFEDDASFIFPFGINESQLKAVENAFSSQVSLIEGPPGTGKTQTILNIVSNILLRGKTVAIVSNNNTAVENVYEKLEKAGLGYLVAKLGNRKNREEFFSSPPAIPPREEITVLLSQQLDEKVDQLKQLLHAINDEAKLQAEIDELTIERKHLLKWQQENKESLADQQALQTLEKYRLPLKKITDLMAYLTILGEKPIKLKNRLALWLSFRILRTRPFYHPDDRNAVINYFQLRYYDKALLEKNSALATYNETLTKGDFDALLASVTESSMAYLKESLQQRRWSKESFEANTYRMQIDSFLSRYPVIGSSTHSIINSLRPGTVIDYAIIDEASQQDIIPGILALGCARNLVVVGDRKQLPPIFTNIGLKPPDGRYDCEKYSLLDSCLRVFEDKAPVTLLKEHYRCRPRIIQFCNQQFYDNQLIPMTKDAGEDSLQLIITSKGNHARNYRNQRELDSLLHVLEHGTSYDWDEKAKRGFIAPYNAQIGLARSELPVNFVKDTTHKFQGRECDEIVFSTVLDKKKSNQRNLKFVDDPCLINVAVSRAKKRFTLVTGEDVFCSSNGHIAALIRYIEYYADANCMIHRSPVVSAFDLLYHEYDVSLQELGSRLRPSDSQYKSEQIVAQLLRERISLPIYQALIFHTEVALNQLVSLDASSLTSDERGFMKGRSRCDFVIYFRVGKKPLAVIEVDGSGHCDPKQKQWDALKNSILEKGGLPLLRVKTVESHIEEKIDKFLASLRGMNSYIR